MRATILEKALEKEFRRAGGVPARQPSTYSLLGGIFAKDDLSKLFSGKLNKTETEKRKKLAMEYLDIMAKLPRGHLRTVEIGMLREKFPRAVTTTDDENHTGIIRFDLKLSLGALILLKH